jgi:hypothetical protein
MTVRTALGIINQVLDEVLAEQEGDFDSDTHRCGRYPSILARRVKPLRLYDPFVVRVFHQSARYWIDRVMGGLG